MKFQFACEGGFMGLTNQYEGLFEDIPDEYSECIALLTSKNEVYAQVKANTKARDVYTYLLEFEHEHETVKLRFDDTNLPQEIEPLFSFLRQQAKPG